MRFFLFLFLFLFSFILAHGEEYVFSKLFDSDFRQVDGESVGMYAYEQYQNGWYIYKSCIPYAGCATLYVYKDKSVIRHSGLYDAGYFSEARLIPAQNKIRPDW